MDKQHATHAATQQALLDGALTVAAQHKWEDISMIDIADAADVPLAKAVTICPDKADVLCLWSTRIAAQVTQDLDDIQPKETCRDRVFDVMMEWYEQLYDHKQAVHSIYYALSHSPETLAATIPYIRQPVRSIMKLSAIETEGLIGGVRFIGMSGIYIRGLHALVQDDTPDLSRLMASLDRDLGLAEDILNILSL